MATVTINGGDFFGQIVDIPPQPTGGIEQPTTLDSSLENFVGAPRRFSQNQVKRVHSLVEDEVINRLAGNREDLNILIDKARDLREQIDSGAFQSSNENKRDFSRDVGFFLHNIERGDFDQINFDDLNLVLDAFDNLDSAAEFNIQLGIHEDFLSDANLVNLGNRAGHTTPNLVKIAENVIDFQTGELIEQTGGLPSPDPTTTLIPAPDPADTILDRGGGIPFVPSINELLRNNDILPENARSRLALVLANQPNLSRDGIDALIASTISDENGNVFDAIGDVNQFRNEVVRDSIAVALKIPEFDGTQTNSNLLHRYEDGTLAIPSIKSAFDAGQITEDQAFANTIDALGRSGILSQDIANFVLGGTVTGATSEQILQQAQQLNNIVFDNSVGLFPTPEQLDQFIFDSQIGGETPPSDVAPPDAPVVDTGEPPAQPPDIPDVITPDQPPPPAAPPPAAPPPPTTPTPPPVITGNELIDSALAGLGQPPPTAPSDAVTGGDPFGLGGIFGDQTQNAFETSLNPNQISLAQILADNGGVLPNVFTELATSLAAIQANQDRISDIQRQELENQLQLALDFAPQFAQQQLDIAQEFDPQFRANELALITALGPAINEIEALANPQTSALRDELNRQVLADLELGAQVDPALQRQLSESIRGAQIARGTQFGPSAVSAEALAQGQFANQLRNERRQAAQDVINLNTATSVDPFSLLLNRNVTRNASATPPQGGIGTSLIPGVFAEQGQLQRAQFNANQAQQLAEAIASSGGGGSSDILGQLIPSVFTGIASII